MTRANDMLINDDHDRGCQGREYSCACGYDARVLEAAQQDAAELTRLRAENARLREAGLAVLDGWFVGQLELMEALTALRAALKEGGG
jgi:hypothetical protein